MKKRRGVPGCAGPAIHPHPDADRACRVGVLQGGKDWFSIAKFYERMYGVGSMRESAARIVDAGLAQALAHDLVFLAHNGPSGEAALLQLWICLDRSDRSRLDR